MRIPEKSTVSAYILRPPLYSISPPCRFFLLLLTNFRLYPIDRFRTGGGDRTYFVLLQGFLVARARELGHRLVRVMLLMICCNELVVTGPGVSVAMA